MAAAEATVSPTALPRRSFIHRVLQQAGARFAPVTDGAIAVDFGKPIEAEVAQARRMGIADLSVLPRTGFKGAGTVEWLTAQGLSIGPDSNRAYPQTGGALAARLAPTEVFLLDGFAGGGDLIRRLNAAWSWGGETPRTPIGYPMPRSESHAWVLVAGEQAAAMFAKVCGVDLRPHRFAVGSISQTSVAKMSAIIIRIDLGGTAAFHVLADSASAEYFWGCLLDAMAEFDGAPVGWTAIRRLAGVD
jgi:sarcosine oxidase subunit gamma